jgi:alpha/beta superfamily hydrolase
MKFYKMANKKILMNAFVLTMAIISCLYGQAQMRTDSFSFSFEGKKYSGLVDLPEQKPATAIIVIVPGSGKTNIVAGNWFSDIRSRFVELGLACLVWDKAGCGKTEGVFDYNQSVQNSASEVVAAITQARSKNIPGSGKVGLWGISRAGWICPLVIEQIPIAFWISVSGTDDKENFGYLLEKNFLIEGRSKSQTKKLVKEWQKGNEIARTGGSFEENLKATENLRKDSFYIFINGNSTPTKEGYLQWQKKFETGENITDKKTGLVIYIPEFEKLLSKIDCPVLALFGEKDLQVDWQKTRTLYKKTIGKNTDADLEIKVLPDCNHNMRQCKTGGYREKLTGWQPCAGYFDAMVSWLKEKGFGN